MYTVQAMVPTVDPSITYPLSEMISSDWEDVGTVPAADTEQEELQDARKAANILRQFYTDVRIIKWQPGGQMGQVVA